ncbi:MAG: hypothetical protein ACREK6_19405, partial [Candidatus Rokuibacteriota bacterium]
RAPIGSPAAFFCLREPGVGGLEEEAMRRTCCVVACVVATVAMLASASPTFAQAPAPKVTITGLVDNVYNWNRNMSQRFSDFDITRSENEAYGRTRGRFDIIGEVGRAKAVLGAEFDLIYGQTGAADSCTAPFQTTGCRGRGISGSFDADNDVRNTLELKWLYVEAPLTGPGSMLPFVPVAGTIRLGGQPYTITYKPHIFAASDFGGGHVDLTLTPALRASVTFAQFEEKLTGTLGPPRNLAGPFRDEDIGFIATVEVTPFKGLNIKPIYSYQEIAGVTSALLRRGTGGIPNNAANFPGGAQEIRQTIGFDARWRSGPWSFGPTFFYQFGDRQTASAGAISGADISAWVFDVEGGWRLGPLLLEARGVISSGNEASDNLRTGTFRVYQPFQIGNAYWTGWGEVIKSVDYLTNLYDSSTSVSLSAQPAYDRYGLAMFAVRGTYSLTPALNVYGIGGALWAWEKVDTDGVLTATAGITPSAAATGDDRFLGTQFTAGLTYRFAPGMSLDLAYGVLFAGDGLDNAPSAGAPSRDAKDVYTATTRLRFVF